MREHGIGEEEREHGGGGENTENVTDLEGKRKRMKRGGAAGIRGRKRALFRGTRRGRW